MEEEKKKRFRPTLGQYRALQSEIEELRANSVSLERYDELTAEMNTLRMSNGHMEGELDRLRDKVKALNEVIRERDMDVYYLRHRSFWDRVFNRN